MELGAFLLTREVPTATAEPGECFVGTVWDGRLTSPLFPYKASFGAFVELRAMPGDVGDVEVSLSYSDGDALFVIPSASRTVPLCGPTVELPVYVPLDVHLIIPRQGVLDLAVAVDGDVVPRSSRPLVAALG
jgi:hypothetical protein